MEQTLHTSPQSQTADTESPPTRRWPRLLLRIAAVLVVTGVGWALRWRAVDLLPIDYDEDDYLRAAQEYADAIRQGDWQAITELNYRPEHPPLAKLVYAGAIAGLPEVVEIPDRPTTAQPAASLPEPHLTRARISAASLGTLEVLLLAILNPLAGLFLGIHTFTIKYTSQVMLEALPALTSALCVVFYERSRVYEGRRINGWLVGSAIMLGLTAASKYLYAVIGFAVILHWGWMTLRTDRRRWLGGWLLPALGWGILAVGVFFASSPYLWPDPAGRLLDSLLYHRAYSQGAAEVQQFDAPFWQPFIWLFGPVPWHPGVFVVMLDLVITIFALFGIKRLAERRPLYIFWIGTVMAFLLVWPTKWPQYILAVTFPWSLAAAEGFNGIVWEPLAGEIRRIRAEGFRRTPAVERQSRWRELRRALLWLLPGVLVISGITFFPLIFQTGMAMTDLTTLSIRDGLRGGIWREVTGGLLGQIEASPVAFFERPSATEVSYIGLSLFQTIATDSADLLFFEVLWTFLSVVFQLGLGVGVALLLNQPGVRWRKFWLTLFMLPWAIPEFIGALSWLQIFDPRSGWLALATQRLPADVVISRAAAWQDSHLLTVGVLLLIGTWMGFPLMMLASTASLKMIPPDVYDSSAIDGANGWQRFRWVTWPMLFPLLTPIIILRTIYAFNQFYLFYVLNPPYPYITASTLAYYLAAPGFFGGWFAAASAVSIFTVIVLLGLLIWFNRWSRAGEGVTYA